MDCREFRNKHVGYVDDLLPAFEMNAMQRHLDACASCARHDTKIRRSLMMVRSLPPIEPSSEFLTKLNERLAELGPQHRDDYVAPRRYVQSASTFAAMAAGLVAVAYMAVETNNYFATPDHMMSPAMAVASAPMNSEPMTRMSPINDAALVASVPTGIPVWPTVLMVGQTPLHFASMEMAETETAR